MTQAISIPIVGAINTQKRTHTELILEGVCSHCAHCGITLTDSVSIERGIGPICSKKGYTEDPVASDEVQALIDLAEYPTLVDFLTEHYKPLGVRGLMNGLVRIASLNRKSEVHSACCDAIQSLGYGKLASLLRESIAVAEIKEDPDYPGFLKVWVKKSEWTFAWTRALQAIHGTKAHPKKGTLVLNHDGRAWTEVDGVKIQNKVLLWSALRKHYLGYIIKTSKGTYKIK